MPQTGAMQDIIRYLRAKADEIGRVDNPLAGGGHPSPPPCLPYPPGATEEQKLCMDQACAIMLIRWIGCGSKLDPETCRDFVHQDYLDAVGACFPEA